MCVREIQHERERVTKDESPTAERDIQAKHNALSPESMCVCVREIDRERERARKRVTEGLHKKAYTLNKRLRPQTRVCVCVCMSLYLLHTEYQNPHSISKGLEAFFGKEGHF